MKTNEEPGKTMPTTNDAPPSDINILIADDSIALRQFLTSALRATSFTVTVAIDGQDAHEKAVANTFDLIITDHNMPHMNGVELIKGLRALPQYKSTPLLVFTVESNEELKQKAKEAGATGWIVKPIHPDTIVALVQKLLNNRLHGLATHRQNADTPYERA